MKYVLEVCGLKVLLKYPEKLQVDLPFFEFIDISKSELDEGSFDCSVQFERMENSSSFDQLEPFYRNNLARYYMDGDEEVICTVEDYSGPSYSECNWNSFQNRKLILRCIPDYQRHIVSVYNYIQMFSFEYLLQKFDTFLLHCSLIETEKGGILFCGPSGIGKSTQADLWAKERNSEIINGDKAGINYKSGSWKAYGLPMAGSSNIFSNKAVPIRTIILLEQGNGNYFYRPSNAEILMKIYPQLMVHRWNTEFQDRAFSFLDRLLNDVPIFAFSCLPDASAVIYLENELKKQNI